MCLLDGIFRWQKIVMLLRVLSAAQFSALLGSRCGGVQEGRESLTLAQQFAD